MSKVTSAILLPAGSNVEPHEVFIDGYKSIQNLVGGTFDCVRTDMGQPDDVAIVGYVHDEGLILGLDMNFLATALFKREIRGDVVVAWGLSPNGYYDGDNYDIPSFVTEFIKTDLLFETAFAYNLATMMDKVCGELLDSDYPDKPQLKYAMRGMSTLESRINEYIPSMRNALDWGSKHLEEETSREFCQLMLDSKYFEIDSEDSE